MDTRFLEAGNGFNWGKFLLGRYDGREWVEQSADPTMPAEFSTPLVALQGWSREHLWILDLATREGAVFVLGGLAKADLNEHRIHVCVLFEPMLEWLYEFHREHAETWWEDLPRFIELPDAPAAVQGYRRPGPQPVRDLITGEEVGPERRRRTC